MALITCPECSKQISDKATRCPHCSYPLNKTIRWLTWNNIFSVALVITGLGVAVYSYYSSVRSWESQCKSVLEAALPIYLNHGLLSSSPKKSYLESLQQANDLKQIKVSDSKLKAFQQKMIDASIEKSEVYLRLSKYEEQFERTDITVSQADEFQIKMMDRTEITPINSRITGLVREAGTSNMCPTKKTS